MRVTRMKIITPVLVLSGYKLRLKARARRSPDLTGTGTVLEYSCTGTGTIMIDSLHPLLFTSSI
jgi:hypothetical protein